VPKIYMWNSKFLVVGNEFSKKYHKHYPLQINISFENKISANCKNHEPIYSNAVLIDSNVQHYCEVDNESISLFIEPETDEGKLLKNQYVKNPINILPFDCIKYNSRLFNLTKNETIQNENHAVHTFNEVLCSFINKDQKIIETDPRIKEILDLLPSIPDKKISVKDLAYSVCLSESRLIHLFKENIGIPIRRYLLWKRMLDALKIIKGGESLTMAAHLAGFSDYAHFSRTFKKSFGATVEKIFKNSKFVQVNIY